MLACIVANRFTMAGSGGGVLVARAKGVGFGGGCVCITLRWGFVVESNAG